MKAHVQRACGAAGVALLMAAVVPACKTAPPPSREQIQAQTLLKDMPLNRPWASADSPNSMIQDNWLATFNDPQLTLLVEEAIRNNPDLSIAATRIEQASANVEVAKSAMRPRIGMA